MEFKSKMEIKGRMHLQLFDSDGNLKDERIIHNVVTDLMDIMVADAMSDRALALPGWMSVGTGNGQVAGDTGLDAFSDRNALTSTTLAANTVIYVGDWAAGDATVVITEAGVFRLNDDATMMVYADFAAINKLGPDTLKITWTVTFG